MFSSPILKLNDPVFLRKAREEYGELLDLQKRAYGAGFPPLTREMRAVFRETGRREDYEVPFFRRRQYLSASALLALLYPEEGYLKSAEYALKEICAEWSWAAPSHSNEETFIDLFAAELGHAVAEILYLLGGRMEKSVVSLAEREVKRRVIEPYEKNTFWWEEDRGNWAMVCAGNVGAAMLYLDPAAFERQKERILRTADCYLSSLTESGTCLEGVGYWEYGFGNFACFAELYRAYSGEDLFRSEKAERAAYFAARSVLGGEFLTVADSPLSFRAGRGLLSFLAKEYGAPVLPSSLTAFKEGNTGWNERSRDLLWYDPTLPPSPPPDEDFFDEEAGQATMRRKQYSLFVKAGHNGEPHNHNDVGSFVLADREGQIFCDLGAGRYTRDYFRGETRYNVLCTSSRGHSVPVVNGKFQRAGREFCGTVWHTEGGVSLEFAAAYGQDGFPKLRRTFLCGETLTLTDEFSAGADITERFVTLLEPVCEGNAVRVGSALLSCRLGVSPAVTREKHALHGFDVQGSGDGTRGTADVFLIDFRLPRGTAAAVFDISFSRH